MSELEERIGICGGTFDPIHMGHLKIAESVRNKFRLDRVLFVPSGNPPHKDINNVASAVHRFNMASLAVENSNWFECSDVEMHRFGKTYSIDTLLLLKQEYAESTKLFYIVGADVIFDLLNWKSPEKVFKQCEFIACLRPGFDKSDFDDRIRLLTSNHKAVIHTINIPLIEVSSTRIREFVKQGKSIKGMVPDSVGEYIFNNALYA